MGTVIRVLILLAATALALAIMFTAALYRETNGERQVLAEGVVLNALALAILIGVAVYTWRWARSRPA